MTVIIRTPDDAVHSGEMQTLWQLHECAQLHVTLIPYTGHPSQQAAST